MTETSSPANVFDMRRKTGITGIGEWQLYPDLAVLKRGADEVRLNAKTLHVLLVLIESVGQGVSRSSLLDQVWGSSYPTDTVVSRAIADLRSAFGEKAGEQRYIRTLPKYGYQLVATVFAGIDNADSQRPGFGNTGNTIEETRPWSKYQQLRSYMGLLALLLMGLFIWWLIDQPLVVNQQWSQALPTARPLTSAPGVEHQPRIAPDGDWVIYAALRPGRTDWDLFRAFTDDASSQPVAVSIDVHEHGPAISPAGDQVAYVRMDEDACAVVVQAVTLGVPEVVTACTTRFPTLVDWSPDGVQLAYTVDESLDSQQKRRLYLVNRFTGESQRLTDAVSPTGSDFYPRYSPSGKQLAFLRGEPQPDHRTSLWLINIETREERRLTIQAKQIGGMTWLDDDNLVYSVEDAGQFKNLRINLKSGAEYPFAGTELIHPDYNPASSSLVASQLSNELGLLLRRPDGEIITVAQSTSDDYFGVLSPDEQRLVFVSRRSGFDELWIAELNATQARQLTRFEGATVRYPDWHPDGERLLFTAQGDQGERLYQVDVVSGVVKTLGPADMDVTTPKWMPDGEQWVFGCQQQRLGLCLGNPTGYRQFVPGLFRPNPVDDNNIYAVNDAGVLHRYQIETNSSDPVWTGLPGNGRFGWAVSGNQLYYLGGSGKTSARLMQRDLLSGEQILLYAGNLSLVDTTLHIGKLTGAMLMTEMQSENDDILIFRGVN